MYLTQPCVVSYAVFVNRVGKSVVAIGLSAVTAYFGPQLDLEYLSLALVVISLLSLLVAYRLTTFLDETIKAGSQDDDDKSKKE